MRTRLCDILNIEHRKGDEVYKYEKQPSNPITAADLLYAGKDRVSVRPERPPRCQGPQASEASKEPSRPRSPDLSTVSTDSPCTLVAGMLIGLLWAARLSLVVAWSPAPPFRTSQSALAQLPLGGPMKQCASASCDHELPLLRTGPRGSFHTPQVSPLREPFSPLSTEKVVYAGVRFHVSPRFPHLWTTLWTTYGLFLHKPGKDHMQNFPYGSSHERKRRYFHGLPEVSPVENSSVAGYNVPAFRNLSEDRVLYPTMALGGLSS